jgi:hypothetical protein
MRRRVLVVVVLTALMMRNYVDFAIELSDLEAPNLSHTWNRIIVPQFSMPFKLVLHSWGCANRSAHDRALLEGPPNCQDRNRRLTTSSNQLVS